MKIILSILIGFTCASTYAQEKITLEDIWRTGKFRASYVRGIRSMNDGVHYTSFYSDNQKDEVFVLKYQYKSGKVVDTILKQSQLLPEGKTEPIEIDDYQFSADESKILINTKTEPIYRRSARSIDYIYERKSGKLFSLEEDQKQRNATFSPSASKIAFVRNNDLFVRDLQNNKLVQVTNDGEYNKIINGAADWVYEEEFAFAKAFFWSPDGNKLAYYKFDESEVKQFSMTIYNGKLYPEEHKFKYPKAGEKNALVSIHVYDLEKGTTVQINVGGEQDQYIPRIKWTKDPDKLVVYRMNRHQNKLDLLVADTEKGSVDVLFTEDNKYYIDITDDITFLKDRQHFIWTSERSGYNHIYLYRMDGKLMSQVTKGDWVVTEFLGINEESNTLYYISAESSPLNRDLYSIKLDGTSKKKLSTKKGWNQAVFSKNFRYYINTWSDANTPYVVTLHESDGKQIRELENNRELQAVLESHDLNKKEFFSFENDESVSLNGWMIKPDNFDPSKKYPVVMFVYGGPGSQTAMDQWSSKVMWHQLLAQEGYIVVSVDNRGTGARGQEFQKSTYMELGKLETIDQMAAAKYLGTLPYVEASRIGIWGWSYGGYMSSLCLTKGSDLFKLAIAVAPVTNWRFYDTIYTERYMRTPRENPNGYDDNSPINHVGKLEGHYLLIHGTADDNVHYQNTIEMINALVAANKQFEQFAYPDKNHGIYGGNTRYHLYRKMLDFIQENL